MVSFLYLDVYKAIFNDETNETTFGETETAATCVAYRSRLGGNMFGGFELCVRPKSGFASPSERGDVAPVDSDTHSHADATAGTNTSANNGKSSDTDADAGPESNTD